VIKKEMSKKVKVSAASISDYLANTMAGPIILVDQKGVTTTCNNTNPNNPIDLYNNQLSAASSQLSRNTHSNKLHQNQPQEENCDTVQDIDSWLRHIERGGAG
jgi:hypothetical protein